MPEFSEFPYHSPLRRPWLDFLNRDFGAHPLPGMVQVALPFEIRRLIEKGGPSDLDRDLTESYADTLSQKADVLLYGGERREAATLFVGLVQSLAVLAFEPGGVRIFGEHYEARPREPESEGE